MTNNETVDQSLLAEDLATKIPYTFGDMFLVKPLDKIMVKKEVTILPDKEPVKGEDGVEAVEGEPKTEVQEVESDYSKGIILKVPNSYNAEKDAIHPGIKPGTIILYKQTRTIPFDLVKTSRLIRAFDIVATVND